MNILENLKVLNFVRNCHHVISLAAVHALSDLCLIKWERPGLGGLFSL